MADLIREAPLGQIIRWVTRRKYLKYPEEKEGFNIPWEGKLDGDIKPVESRSQGDVSNDDTLSKQETVEDAESGLAARVTRTKTRENTTPWSEDRFEVEQEEAAERAKSAVIVPTKTSDGIILVDWYATVTVLSGQILLAFNISLLAHHPKGIPHSTLTIPKTGRLVRRLTWAS